MLNISVDLAFKICVIGDAGVGKTTLVRRYLTDYFEREIGKSMGVDINVKKLDIEGKNVTLQVWDFVGDVSFRSFLPVYGRGASGAIFMYDITNKESVMNRDDWLNFFNKPIESGKQIPIFIVGGKSDLSNNRSISLDEVRTLTRELEIFDYIECSSKTGQNIDVIFEKLTLAMMQSAGFI